jgi:hypothetical protein
LVLAVERHEDPEGTLVLDDRYYPVVIGTWWGRVGHGSIDAYYGWYDRQLARAGAEGIKLVVIVDGLDVAPTTAEIRRRFVRETDARAEARRRCVASVLVVARGAFLLGMIAAIVSLVRGGMRLSTFGEMRPALEQALTKLDAVGVPRPASLDPRTYARPR